MTKLQAINYFNKCLTIHNKMKNNIEKKLKV